MRIGKKGEVRDKPLPSFYVQNYYSFPKNANNRVFKWRDNLLIKS